MASNTASTSVALVLSVMCGVRRVSMYGAHVVLICFDIIPLYSLDMFMLADDNVSFLNAQSCNIGFAIGINMMIHDYSR